MSNVLEFRPASAGGPVSFLAPKGTVEIVIFPGIRYERSADAGAHSSEPSRGGTGRRRRGSKSGSKS